MDSRAEWLSLFEVWLKSRFLAEFEGGAWVFTIDPLAGKVHAGPAGSQLDVVVSIPPYALNLQPYVVAARVAADLRVKAEELQLVAPRRTLRPPEPPESDLHPPDGSRPQEET